MHIWNKLTETKRSRNDLRHLDKFIDRKFSDMVKVDKWAQLR